MTVLKARKGRQVPVLVVANLNHRGRLFFELSEQQAVAKVQDIEEKLAEEGEFVAVSFVDGGVILVHPLQRGEARALANQIADLLDEIEVSDAGA